MRKGRGGSRRAAAPKANMTLMMEQPVPTASAAPMRSRQPSLSRLVPYLQASPLALILGGFGMGFLLVFFLILAVNIVVTSLLVRAELTEDIGSSLNLGKVWAYTKATWKDTLIAYIVLTPVAMIIMFGGMLISITQLKVAASIYWTNVTEGLYLEDIWMGLLKPIALGFALMFGAGIVGFMLYWRFIRGDW